MSQLNKARVSLAKDVTAQQSHTVIKYQGQELSKAQLRTAQACLVQWTLLVFDTLLDRNLDRSPELLAWQLANNEVDLFDLAFVLKSSLSFLHHIDGKSREDYGEFKQRLTEQFPCTDAILSIVDERFMELCDSKNPIEFTAVNLFLSYPTRLNLELDFSSPMEREYRENEERLGALSLSTVSELGTLNKIAREFLKDFVLEDLIPSHGPGSVAMLKDSSLYSKYYNLHSDMRVRYLLNKVGMIPSDILIDDDDQLERVSELVIVPKSMTTGRTISKEPATLQYLQQGIMKSLDSYIRHHRVLSRHISIHDQVVLNQNMARQGSQDPTKYATIDLSAASDSVSWELVKRLFTGLPLLVYLYTSKSDRTLLPGGEIIPIRKFAPMGSALCFPIETLIFAICCEYVCRFSGIHFRDNPYCVYGDDIVIDTRLVSPLISLLTKIGFLVNTEKSFFSIDNTFRESCGGEYYHGEDVSPLRVSRRFKHANLSYHPNLYEAYVQMANAATTHGFVMLRSWFIQELFKLPQHLLPVFSFGELGLHSSSCSNFHLVCRLVQREEYVRCGGISVNYQDPILPPEHDYEAIRYFEWLRSTARRKTPPVWPEDLCTSEIRSSTPKLRSRLVQKPLYVNW